MEQPQETRYIVRIEEGPTRGDLFELEQATFFHIVDLFSGEVILTFRGDMEASLSRDNAQWDDYHYSGVSQVTISPDQKTARVEYFNRPEELVPLPPQTSGQSGSPS